MSFNAEIRAAIGWEWDEGAVDSNRLDYSKQFLSGNGDNQAEAVWHVESQTLPSETSTVLNLAALGRTVLGDLNTVTFLTIKALLVVSERTTGGTLVVGGAPSNQWWAPFGVAGCQAVVPPDSLLLMCNRKSGWNVDATHSNLQLAATGGDATYSIAIVGTMSAPGSG